MAEAVSSRVKLFVRAMYSNPPLHGAKVAATILSDRALYAAW
jgi:aspartate/tyrosine/aromatic aminotransferase